MEKSIKLMKKSLIMALMFVLLSANLVLAETLTYKDWPSKEGVEQNKTWNIKFSLPFNENTINNNIKIIDNVTGKLVNYEKSFNSLKDVLSVTPISNYNYGHTYTMYIENQIQGVNGKKLSSPLKFQFTIKNEEIVMPNSEINNKEEFKKAIKYALANFEDSLTITINNYSKGTYNLNVINEIICEEPIINYGYDGASASYNINSDKDTAVIKISFKYNFSKETMQHMKKCAEDRAQEIINKVIKPGMKDYEKELALHDYVVNHAEYDKRVPNEPSESHTDYGILVKGVGVCEGYAKTMYRLLNAVGIECLYVTGQGNGGPHAWNIVKIEGEYYHLDATWDDPFTSSGKQILDHSYFNLSDEQMVKNHYWEGDYPKCTSTTYNYKNLAATRKRNL